MKITIEQVENGYILFFHDEEQTKKVVCGDDEIEKVAKALGLKLSSFFSDF